MTKTDKRMYEILEPGFELSKIKPRIFNFSVLKWLFKKKNINLESFAGALSIFNELIRKLFLENNINNAKIFLN
jgi:hypothetical protein